MSGRDLDLARPPRNVVVLAPVLSPYAAIAGNLKDVDAVSDFVRRNENTGAFRLVFPHLATMPIVSLTGAVPDPEQVLRFSPDAVLAWRLQSDALRDTGYPGLVELEWNAKIDGDAERLWDFLGKLFKRGAAEQIDLAKGAGAATGIASDSATSGHNQGSDHESVSGRNGVDRQKGYFLNPLLRDLRAVNLTGDLHLGDIISAEQYCATIRTLFSCQAGQTMTISPTSMAIQSGRRCKRSEGSAFISCRVHPNSTRRSR